MSEWVNITELDEGDVFKLVDMSNSGVYVVRSLDPPRYESVRYGHEVKFDEPQDRHRQVLRTCRGRLIS